MNTEAFTPATPFQIMFEWKPVIGWGLLLTVLSAVAMIAYTVWICRSRPSIGQKLAFASAAFIPALLGILTTLAGWRSVIWSVVHSPAVPPAPDYFYAPALWAPLPGIVGVAITLLLLPVVGFFLVRDN